MDENEKKQFSELYDRVAKLEKLVSRIVDELKEMDTKFNFND